MSWLGTILSVFRFMWNGFARKVHEWRTSERVKADRAKEKLEKQDHDEWLRKHTKND